ncbi:hypothetical protein SAY87_000120 [Trapa incisa]|uniref:Transmembrane protein 33 homolog n=1 Tax=Trapa incisa TaxID=236973 RepID=A0AAN7JFZ1_9MYRT|nr:hypothetical protein SAY87_000120 [Trapa incisa]
MGEEGEDPQRLKKIAAAAYDYDNDPRWADYWSNILIPPQMASNSDVVDHYKRKFYQRFIDPSLVVEAISSSSSSQGSRRSAPSSASSTTTSEHVGSRSSGTTAQTSGSSTTNPSSMGIDRQTLLFSINAWVLVVAVLAIFPLIPKNLSSRAYQLTFMGTTLSSLISVYSLYGKPRAWNMQALQAYFQSVIVTEDFMNFIFGLTFLTAPAYFRSALIPVLCHTIVHLAKFLRRNFTRSTLYRRYLEEPCVSVESNISTLGILSSQAEIALGFLILVSLFSRQRNVLLLFMYWQQLKLMYHAPATGGYHRSVWAKIGQTILPLVHCYAPFLNGLLSAAQRWWFR